VGWGAAEKAAKEDSKQSCKQPCELMVVAVLLFWLLQSEYMTSNAEMRHKYQSVEEAEDDFM
jgi:hypothetical protein